MQLTGIDWGVIAIYGVVVLVVAPQLEGQCVQAVASGGVGPVAACGLGDIQVTEAVLDRGLHAVADVERADVDAEGLGVGVAIGVRDLHLQDFEVPEVGPDLQLRVRDDPALRGVCKSEAGLRP